jgi:hypothetical protein
MKSQTIRAFAAVALFAAAFAILRSHSTDLSGGAASMPSLQELHTAAGANKLSTQEFEDMSLVYSTATKR